MLTSTKTNIKITIDWPYEVDKNTLNTANSVYNTLAEADAEDTYWGEQAYKYHKDNPDKYSIVVKMDIKAIQKEGNENTNTNVTP